MNSQAIDQIRRFNRLVTAHAGALDSSYLGRKRPLGQARLLFEIGSGENDASRLRSRLGLDSGYFSRLTKSLISAGLIRSTADPADGRRRLLTLTKKGETEYAAYDALSERAATSVLRNLGKSNGTRLVAAMAEVERLLTASAITVHEEDASSTDAQACLAAYYDELSARFEEPFDPYAGAPETDPPGAKMLIARLHGEAVGCGMLRPLTSDIGEIKRMWVAPHVRGLGLSRRLLEALEHMALGESMEAVRLDTNRTLQEAQSLYRKAGYREIAAYNDNPYAHLWFEKSLNGDEAPARA